MVDPVSFALTAARGGSPIVCGAAGERSGIGLRLIGGLLGGLGLLLRRCGLLSEALGEALVGGGGVLLRRGRRVLGVVVIQARQGDGDDQARADHPEHNVVAPLDAAGSLALAAGS